MDNSTLEELKALLIARQLKIAVAESVTCGNLQAALGSISGSSAFFEGGVTAYNQTQKIRLLAVDPFHAAAVNAVSPQVSRELATGVCRLFQSDIGIGTTGYAEPCPEQQVYEPVAHVAICRNYKGIILPLAEESIAGKGLERIAMQKKVVDKALQLLLGYLTNEQE